MRFFVNWFGKLASRWGRSPIGLACLVFALLLALASLGFWWIELRPKGQGGFFSALYWAVVTLTTVGYGDLVPSSLPGRILGMVIMASGVVLLSALSANLASLLVERKAQQRMGLLQVYLSNHIVVLGWNLLTHSLLRTLLDTVAEDSTQLVLVNELPQEKREELLYQLGSKNRIHFVYGNPTQKSIQAKSCLDKAKVVYIVAQEGLEPAEADQQSIYAALTLRSLAPNVPVYGEVLLHQNREHLLRAGVSEILARGETGHHILGLMGTSPTILPFFQQLLGVDGKGLLGYRVLAPDEKSMTWGDLQLAERKRSGGLPLALCRESRAFRLQDMLDEESALDQFVLDLFAASGRKTDLGHTAPHVLVNPPETQPLEGFDSLLLLNPGKREH